MLGPGALYPIGFCSSLGGQHLDSPIVSMGDTPDGNGYRLTAANGEIYTFGDARFHGDSGVRLQGPAPVTLPHGGLTRRPPRTS